MRAANGSLGSDGRQVIVRMPTDLHAAAVARAKAEERSLAQLIRFACRRYLDTPPTRGAT